MTIEAEKRSSLLNVEQLRKNYGTATDATPAIGDVSFNVQEGEFVCVVGSSGCGKTTLLKCMSGLMAPSSGSVAMHGQRIVAPPATMALVFQDYNLSLYPWMTVERNIAFPLKQRHMSKSTLRATVEEAAQSVGLGAFLGLYPWQLSGGMQQRTAIARALAYQPEILLMDEPFASVDALTRAQLEDLILSLHKRFGMTIVLVTHDIDESVYLADRVVVLTPRPSEVQEVVRVDLPRPRDQITTKESPLFAELRAHVYRNINPPATSPFSGATA